MARKILLADDSVTAQNMGRKILTDAGYEVITVNNGSSALKKITEIKPDVIVLDVYMPGYSGLEVCQRIKEADGTARIPVLLTVGKLEPFKQEEARRARADAFIIKPFEATELLAAVGKLQDKLGIVPPTPPAKERRGAPPTMASFERTVAESAPKFGDEESGWKARLPIQTTEHKQPEPAEEAGPAPASFRDAAEPQPPAARATSFERPIPAGIPRDITADEIAAITAAAARVNVGLNVGKDFERLKRDSQPEFTVVTSASPEEPERGPSSRSTETASPARSTELEKISAASTTHQSAPVVETAAVASSKISEPSKRANVEPPVAVAEPATMAAAPRWVAEEIALEAHEAVVVLEREMHKAFAAFAAAEYAAIPAEERGAVDKSDEPLFATMAPPAIGTPVPIAEESKSENQAGEAEESTSAAAEPPIVQELPKPPAPSFTPAGPAPDEPEHAVVAFGAPTPFGDVADESHDSELESPAPAIAAEQQAQELPTATAAKTDSEAPKSDRNQKQEIELKPAEQEPMLREAAMAAAASADGSSSELSSIVDNMLAELKPKLMAELAKKLEQKK